ncbi:MAG: hypothetical protein NT001_03845 [Candidatus Woesearchaeota archaeon]|nr:hypothetical protein [Candidatus Woesearchaeota archaeon]
MKAKTKAQIKACKAQAKAYEAKAKAYARKEIAVAKKKLALAERKLTGYANKNPEKAMLIAAAIGTAVGAGVVAAMKKGKKRR